MQIVKNTTILFDPYFGASSKPYKKQKGQNLKFEVLSFYCFEPLVGFEPTTPRLQITCSGQLS